VITDVLQLHSRERFGHAARLVEVEHGRACPS
jgi:hypothetical protein